MGILVEAHLAIAKAACSGGERVDLALADAAAQGLNCKEQPQWPKSQGEAKAVRGLPRFERKPKRSKACLGSKPQGEAEAARGVPSLPLVSCLVAAYLF